MLPDILVYIDVSYISLPVLMYILYDRWLIYNCITYSNILGHLGIIRLGCKSLRHQRSTWKCLKFYTINNSWLIMRIYVLALSLLLSLLPSPPFPSLSLFPCLSLFPPPFLFPSLFLFPSFSPSHSLAPSIPNHTYCIYTRLFSLIRICCKCKISGNKKFSEQFDC